MNKEELVIGFAFGMCFWPIIGLLALPLACLTSLLWALGGTYNKAYRRFGVPVVTAAFTGLWFSIPGAIAILSIGYGIPTTQPPDEGSVLGRFVYKLMYQNEHIASLITRGIIFALLVVNYGASLWLQK